MAGLSALLLAQNPDRTPDEIRTIINSTAEDQTGNPLEDVSGFDIYYGYGRINAYQALQQGIVSLDEPDFEDIEFSIYPNPSSGHLFISGENENKAISIKNVLGQEFYYNFLVQPEATKVDVGDFPKGIYILNVFNGNRIIASRKIMIK